MNKFGQPSTVLTDKSTAAQQMLDVMRRTLAIDQRVLDALLGLQAGMRQVAGLVSRPAQQPAPAPPTQPAAQANPAPPPATQPRPAAGQAQSPLGTALQQLAGALPVFGTAASQLVAAARQVAQAVARPAPQPPRQTPPGGAAPVVPAAGGGGALTGIAAAAVPIAAVAVAASAAAGAMQQVASTATQFVQALTPALVMQLGAAVRDFSATVGVALTPVVEAATAFSRMLGSAILPVMEQLRPVVAQLSQVFVNVAAAGVRAFAGLAQAALPLAEAFAAQVQALEPLLQAAVAIQGALSSLLAPAFAAFAGVVKVVTVPVQAVGEALSALAPLFEAFGAVMSGVASAVSSAFEGLLAGLGIGSIRDAFSWLRDAVQATTRGFLLFAARLASWLPGGNAFIDGVVRRLEAQGRDNTGIAAPQNAVTGADFRGLLNAMTQAALLAGPGGQMKPVDPQEAWRREVVEELKKIRGNTDPKENRRDSADQPGRPQERGYTAEQQLADSLRRGMLGATGAPLLPGAGMVPGGGMRRF